MHTFRYLYLNVFVCGSSVIQFTLNLSHKNWTAIHYLKLSMICVSQHKPEAAGMKWKTAEKCISTQNISWLWKLILLDRVTGKACVYCAWMQMFMFLSICSTFFFLNSQSAQCREAAGCWLLNNSTIQLFNLQHLLAPRTTGYWEKIGYGRNAGECTAVTAPSKTCIQMRWSVTDLCMSNCMIFFNYADLL